MTSPIHPFPASVLLAVALSVGCGEVSDPAAATPATASAPETLVLGVQGMHCDGCATAISTKVGRVDGVQSCEVSLDEGTAAVVADPKSFEEVRDAIAGLGYTIVPAPE